MGMLWKHSDFNRLWAGETVEWLTDSISSFGIPSIAVKVFNAGALDMGLLFAFNNVAYPILGVFAGVMVDRLRRKPILVWTNFMQVLALGSIPAAFFLGILSLYQLFLVALTMSITTVFFTTAYTAYLPTLIRREDLVEGNSKLETSRSGATVVGPGIAGSLFQWVGAAPSIAIDALGTLIAALAILSIRMPEPAPPPADTRHFWRELREGVRVVLDTPALRTLAASTSILNVGNGMFLAVVYLFIYKQLNFSFEAAGIATAAAALGFVIGAVVAPRLLRRIGLSSVLTLALLINGFGLLTIQFSAYGPALILFPLMWLFANIGIPIYNISQVSYRQAIVPDQLQGRMNATMRSFGYGAATVGGLVGGVIGSAFGIISVLTVGPLIALLPAFLIHFSAEGRFETPQKTNS